MKPKSSKAAFVDTETTCLVCFAEFLDPEDLVHHNSLVHAEKSVNPFKCNFCDARKSDIEEYMIHIRDEHIADLFCCLYCARTFIDQTKQKQHEEKHHSDIPGMLACSNCTVLFNSVSALENHELTCDVDRPNSIMLQKYYPHLSSILSMKADEFLQLLGNDALFCCCVCRLVASDVKVYIKHLQKRNCRALTCNSCHQTFPNKMTLYNHFTYHEECSHIPSKERPKKRCTKCNQLFDFEIIKTHRNRCKAIKCVTCKQGFETVTELTDHQRTAHPQALMLKTCRYCRQVFAGLKLLRKHMKRNHSDYRAYKYTCVHCSEIFKHPNVLFNHFYLKHKELKPFSCKICNETFQIRRKFSLHIKLKHDSVGFVESDEKWNVYFSNEKSAQPFKPKENLQLFNDDEKLSGDSDGTDIETAVETQKKTSKAKTIGTRNTRAKRNKTRTAGKAVDNQSQDVDTEEAHRLEKIEPLTRKRRRLQREIDEFESSDDESLLAISKRAKRKRQMQIQMTKINKHKFSKRIMSLTCNICKRSCFTMASYHRHMTTHYNSETKQCAKCAQTFTSRTSLHDHMKEVHSMSQITDTLRKVLERRKAATAPQIPRARPMSHNFQKTVKKVKIPPSECEATLRAEETKLSVRNFLESFTPEEGRKKVAINNTVTVKPLEKERERQPKIKLRKFVQKICAEPGGLKMPVHFGSATFNFKATIKLYQGPNRTASLNFGTPIVKEQSDDYDEYNQEETYFEDNVEDHNGSIPEVAHEVMLENTEEQNMRPTHPLNISHKVILPKMKHKIKIAHMQPEAPFFKIVSIDEVVKGKEQKKQTDYEMPSEIYLPSGTKLVHANPLAHLLQGKNLEEFRKFTEKKGKYYQPKYDHSAALAKALMNMEENKPTKKKPYQKRAPRKKKNVAEVEK